MPTCPYCNQPAELVTGDVIYPHRKDLYTKFFWRCEPCDARVGTHPDDAHTPLGRMANARLRRLKQEAHAAFDWVHSTGQQPSRSAAYRWLAGQLGIPTAQAHIGMFDEELCQRTIEIASAYRIATVRDLHTTIEMETLHAPTTPQAIARPDPVARPSQATRGGTGEAHWRLGHPRLRKWGCPW